MRILYSHRVQSRDGQSVHIDELVTAFRKAGHEVIIVGPKLYEQAKFGTGSRIVATVRYFLPNICAEMVEIAYNVPAFWRLRRACRKFSPDFVYERYNLYYLAGMLLSRWYGIPFCLEINSPLADERASFGGLALRKLARNLERFVWRSADRIFVVSGVLKQMVAATGVAAERIMVTPNGVDRNAFAVAPYRARQGPSVNVGFVGFVREWHGLDAVIAGLAAERGDPAVHLIIVGDGPARPNLEHQARVLGVGDLVQFTGICARAEISSTIKNFDIAVQPRAVSYASPLKLFEYMACGRAIVAPDQPNIREILNHNETAILFDPDKPRALWCAIRRLADNPDLRERLGGAARRELDLHDYTWEGNIVRIKNAVADYIGIHRKGDMCL
jgi:glycosyltransferase involved in cell wall biosynthesis